MSRRIVLILGLLLVLAGPLTARLGGGQDYSSSYNGSSYSGDSSYTSGGSYSSSSSSDSYSSSYDNDSSGGSETDGVIFELLAILIFELLMWLILEHPRIGVPLVLVAFGLYRYHQIRERKSYERYLAMRDWSEKHRSNQPASQPVAQPADLSRLKALDPDFSTPLFLDFALLLYTKLHGGDKETLAAYVSPRSGLLQSTPVYSRVLVAGIRVGGVILNAREQLVSLVVDANLESEKGRLHVEERLTLKRLTGLRTKPPEQVYKLACPNCGSPAPASIAGVCASCETVVNTGSFDWQVVSLERIRTLPAPKVVLTGSGLEAGTMELTKIDPYLEAVERQIRSDDPAFSTEALKVTARSTFLRLQEAWNERALEKARPLETDFLFHQHQIQLDVYRREGLRNVLEDVEVTDVHLARLQKDAYFETATLRIFARMKDYTVREADGAEVGGDAHRVRSFSEYWTFIRRAGVATRSRPEGQCPGCGASLEQINMAGCCAHCNSIITRGDFGWVLSRIEQDEAYLAR